MAVTPEFSLFRCQQEMSSVPNCDGKGNGKNESNEGIHIAVTMAQKNICKKYDITVVL